MGQLTSSEDVQVKLSIHFLANQVIFGSNFGDDTVCACRFPFPKGFMERAVSSAAAQGGLPHPRARQVAVPASRGRPRGQVECPSKRAGGQE